MPKKPSIILLSNIYWYTLREWSIILATKFANAGYRTVFVETTGLANPRLDKESGLKVFRRLLDARSSGKTHPSHHPTNLITYSPIVAPPTNKVFRRLNRTVLVPKVAKDLRSLVGSEPVVMAYTPTQTTLDLLSELKPRLAWYHCTSNYEEYPGTPSDIADTERRLLELANLVTVDSSFLQEKHSKARPDMIHIESGVHSELFQQARTSPLEVPPRKVYFFGTADNKKFNFDLVRGLAGAGFTIRMLGTLCDPSFAQVPGIEYLGPVPHESLPGHLRQADALIIPYEINAFSKGIFPAKMYECLATGKPTVATLLPDLLKFGEHIYLAEGAEEFIRVLRQLPKLETQEKIRARLELARENSWEARFEQFEKLLWQKIRKGSAPTN